MSNHFIEMALNECYIKKLVSFPTAQERRDVLDYFTQLAIMTCYRGVLSARILTNKDAESKFAVLRTKDRSMAINEAVNEGWFITEERKAWVIRMAEAECNAELAARYMKANPMHHTTPHHTTEKNLNA